VYNVERPRAAYYGVKRDAAPGIDGETWTSHGRDLEANLQDLSGRLRRGAYRAKPARRTYIPKVDGRQRPLGIPVLEDMIVHRATVEVLQAIYEEDFLGFSLGERIGRVTPEELDHVVDGLNEIIGP
jgi:retron-type reverse transcriptase